MRWGDFTPLKYACYFRPVLQRTAEPGDLPADVAQVLVDFARYVRGEGAITLDQAFGFCVPSGGDPWFSRLARDRRDEAGAVARYGSRTSVALRSAWP
jgi:hypothetical protein